MIRIWILFSVLSVVIGCSAVIKSQTEVQQTETKIRSVLCAIDNKNFASAGSTLENVLRLEPQNIYALRLLPGVTARQIKQNDASPENLKIVGKAIAAYDRAAINPVFKDERGSIIEYVIELYGKLGTTEKVSALLKRAENESAPPGDRAAFYAALAADDETCANLISDVAPVKSIVRRNGRPVYVFRKPKNPAEFSKLKQCAAAGNNFIEKALALDSDSERAWKIRADLYAQYARIAEMEGQPDIKAQFYKKYDAAFDKSGEISQRRIDENTALSDQLRLDEEKARQRSAKEDAEAEIREIAKEMRSTRFARSLDQDVYLIYIPSEPLSEPPLRSDDTTSRRGRARDIKRKKEWQTFSSKSGFSALLPGEVEDNPGESTSIYRAQGNDLSFYIMENKLEAAQEEGAQDLLLNSMARLLTRYTANKFFENGGLNQSFESDLIEKIEINGLPSKIYDYRLKSCREDTKGKMIFIKGQNKNYGIAVQGINDESMDFFRRFLKSLKLD